MTIKLPPASELDKHIARDQDKPKMSDIVERWINEKLLPEVINKQKKAGRHDKHCYVGVRPPTSVETYKASRSNLFYNQLELVLTPLGYKAVKSHDGGGMYEVTQVSWELS